MLQELRRLRDLKTTPADAENSHHRHVLVGFAKTFDLSTQETYFKSHGSWWRARFQMQPPYAGVQAVEGTEAATQPVAEGAVASETQATSLPPTTVLEEAGRLDADTLLIYANVKLLAEQQTATLSKALKVSSCGRF